MCFDLLYYRSARAFGSAILCLLVALLFRSAPYPYWHWQGGQILELLKRIHDGGHAEKFTLGIANCPGLFLPSTTQLNHITTSLFQATPSIRIR